MINFTLSQLRTMRAVADAGSLVGAATALALTPAALTARVKALEAALGVLLFDRTSAGLKANAAGQVALDAARSIDASLRLFEEAMQAVRLGHGGRLSVGAVSTAKYFAPRLIAAFMAERPRLDLRFSIGNRAEMIETLRNFDVEIALTGRPPVDLPIEKIAIGEHPYVIIAAPDHPLARKGPLSKADLADQAFLMREQGSGTRSVFETFMGDTMIRSVPMGMELGSNETIKQAVMAGLGIALLSAHTIAAEVADQRLATLEVEGLPIIKQWFVVSRADRPLTPAASAFREFARLNGSQFLPMIHGGQAPVGSPRS